MKRLIPSIAAMLVLGALPAGASAQTFRTVAPVTALPSYTQPNAPGQITVPFDLSRPPARPAVRSYQQLLGLWQRAGQGYGVPWQVLAAINRIESNLGQNMGPSSAGAVGWMQFIPSSWARWGMDGDGDGLADPWNPEDAVFAAARYLAAAGAHDDLERAIYAYNHAWWYVEDVLELAATFGDDPLRPGAGRLVYDLAGLEKRLAAARRKVARLNRDLTRLERRSDRLDAALLPLRRQAGDPSLGDAAFERLEARIARLEDEGSTRGARREALVARLADAVAALKALEGERAGAALAAQPTGGGAPGSVDGYVFPVGGGPELVSVAHDHHDYPAADIAAPEGSPLYALADSTVVESYPSGSGRCGIGFKLLVEQSGAVFVYCHLSYLEPHVQPGTALAAGSPVGLVGSTGNSTGPHLHLGFVPSLSYPQEEPWFQAFAGRAFRWQDAPTPEPPDVLSARGPAKKKAGKRAADAPVFRVERTRVVRFTRG